MRTGKRILSLMLAGLIATSLAGCEAGEKPESKSPEKAAYDFQGETVTIVDQYEALQADDDRTKARIEQVEKDFHVKIEIVKPKGNYGTSMIASIASGSPAGHILSARDSAIAEWYTAGVFADLTAAMKKTGIDFKDSNVYNPIVTTYTNIDGQQLCFSRSSPLYLRGVWMFNKRIFEEMNLESPYALYEKGEWTWDKVEEIAAKATIRKSDGKVTQWGLASYMGTPMVTDMVLCNGGTLSGFTSEGTPSINLKDPKTVEALERFNTWANVKKILRTNDGSEVWDTVYKEFPNGNIAIFAGNALSYAREANMKDEYGFVGCPKGPSAAGYTDPVSSFFCFFVPKTYESQADRLIALIDALWQPFKGVSAGDLITEEYAESLYDEESLNNLISLAEKPLPQAFDALQVFNLEWVSPSMSDMIAKLLKGGTSVGSLTEEFQTNLETNAKEIWGDLKLTGK